MVSLTSGDLNYNIPIMDVGGYPINLAYTSGITMDQEASWVGLGWNLNVGQITRNVRGLPDDFRGDELNTSNNMRKNITIGVNPYINGQIIGALDNLSAGAGLNVQYNNYRGLSATPSFGMSFKITDNVAVGMQLTSSAEEGVSITPNVNVSLSTEIKGVEGMANSLSANISPSITYNSRQGLQNFNLATGLSMSSNYKNKFSGTLSSQGSGGISFVNNTFTPSKRLAFNNSNITFAFSLGPDGFGAHMEGSITAYASIQELKDKNVTTKAYGYEYTHLA
ncbi:hypothetical protein, partial [uncultured Chryseobacterium sp.]|uniref:hypothetical protein n=1 Tax=uncultured Chryseobacterium sp. TaxID=259322 RepID=UPI00258ECB87